MTPFKLIATHPIVEPSWMYRNDTYTVTKYGPLDFPGCPSKVWHLSFSRIDRGHAVDWRDKQFIKNQLVGKEHEAVELFPAESRLLDAANQFHLWVLADASARFPFGYLERCVTDERHGGSAQRPGSGATEEDERVAAHQPNTYVGGAGAVLKPGKGLRP